MYESGLIRFVSTRDGGVSSGFAEWVGKIIG